MSRPRPTDSPSGVTSSMISPLVIRSRRTSVSSSASRQPADRGALAQTLDNIHTTASRSETLTTFNDFDLPPRSSFGSEERGVASNVQGGFGALYTRLKASVVGGREVSQVSSNGLGISNKSYRPGTSSSLSRNAREVSPADAAHSSPSVAPSHPSPRESRADKRAKALESSGPGQISGSLSFDHGFDLSPNTDPSNQSMHSIVPESLRKVDDLNLESASRSQPRHASTTAGVSSSTKTSFDQRLDSTAYDHNLDVPYDASPEVPMNIEEAEEVVHIAPHDGKILPNDLWPNTGKAAGPLTIRTEQFDHPFDTKHRSIAPEAGTVQQPRPNKGAEMSRPHSRTGSSKDKAVEPTGVAKRVAAGNRQGDTTHPRGFMSQMRRSVLGKELWMRDENAKVCFNCGESFSTFRRKHHCRTCGQIYDAKCTVLIPGKLLNQDGKLRVCKTCESIINGDDSSDYSEMDETPSTPQMKQIRFSTVPEEVDAVSNTGSTDLDDGEKASTPETNPSVIRRVRDGRRRSVTILLPDNQSILPRPGSSRSLKSLGNRPRSGSQKHRRSRSQHMRSLGLVIDDAAPFQNSMSTEQSRASAVPAFQTQWGADAIIDPELAPFVSDEGSSEDEPASIAATLHNETPTTADARFTGLFGAFKKSRLNPLGTNILEPVSNVRDSDNVSVASSRPGPRRPKMGVRALSAGSVGRYGPSIRPTRADNIITISHAHEALILEEQEKERLKPDLRRPNATLQRGITYDHAATSSEMSPASLRHVEKLLRQFLQDAAVDKPRRWEKALMPILLRCAQNVEPNIHRGDDIDIRHYIKLKRAPGGMPSDSHYVSGVVFSKNVALKDMPRHIKNARILILSFPLVYARRQVHFVSLEPIIAQEKEYLRNLVNRILLLKPHVLLVQHNVSGLALQFLQDAHIAVAQNVKQSTLQAISRCTQTRIISSVEKLNMNSSQLGYCEAFDIKTILYRGVKKSYIYISGCQKDLGCTIMLRGAGLKTLSKVKWITEFMCYVAYNIKLETCLLRDEFVALPSIHDQEKVQKPDQDDTLVPENLPSLENSLGDIPNEVKSADTEPSAAPARSNEDPYNETNATKSPLAENEADTIYLTSVPHSKTTVQIKDTYDRTVRTLQKRFLSVSPFVELATPYLLERVRDQEQQLNRLQRLLDQDDLRHREAKDSTLGQNFQLVRPEMVYNNTDDTNSQVREVLRAVHDAEYERSLHHYTTLRRRWETSIALAVEPFSPLSHQRIVVLFSIVSTFTSDACVGPDLLGLDFYQEREVDQTHEPDVPLGEYVERLCSQVDESCTTQNCDKKMIDHHRQYVHGHGQVSVYVKRHAAKLRGMENTILMWSSCRVCEQETQVVSMSGSAWKYSFGKYLELCFWSSPLHPRAGSCVHDIHRDHIRMFGYRGVVVRVQYDAINIVEVVVPRTTVTWKVERDLGIKNDEYQRIEERLTAFMASVKQRIKSINFENINPEKVEACKEEIAHLAKKANDEYHMLINKLRQKYLDSKYHEIMPLNQAVRTMQEKVADWDQAFHDFEKNFYPSEKDLRKLAALQLRRMYLGIDDSSAGNGTGEKEPKSSEIEMEHMPREEEKQNFIEDDALPSLGGDYSSVKLPESSLGVKDMPMASPLSKRRSISDRGQGLARPESQQLTVDQLDLAVPHLTPEAQITDESKIDETSMGGAFNASVTSAVDHPSPVLPLHPEVAEKVEQMTKPLVENADDEAEVIQQIEQVSTDNPIRSNLVVAPPLFRAQSTPNPGENSIRSPIIKKCLDAAEASEILETGSIRPSTIFSAFLQTPAQRPENVNEGRIAERIGLGAFRTGKTGMQSMIPRPVNRARNESKVSALAKHFEEMSREFEKERMRERHQRALKNRQARAYPMASSKPIIEIFRDAHEAVQEQDASHDDVKDSVRDDKSIATFDGKTLDLEDSVPLDDEDDDDASQSGALSEQVQSSPKSVKNEGSPTATGPSADGPMPDIDVVLNDTELLPLNETHDSFTLPDSQELEAEEASLDVEIPKHEKSSLMKMLTSFWSERSASGWTQLDYPLVPTDHIFPDSDVIVREDEPSSLIAFALASQDYNYKLRKSMERLKIGDPLTNNAETYRQLDDFDVERMLLGKTATHMRCHVPHGSARMQCKVFYSESFDAIRRKCGVAERFVESLSRCFKWDSKGGKTKSLFLKTLDERFVIKSLSQIETQAFLKFAPDYFDYMSKCLFHGLPSALAKMLGFYQVTIKNPVTGVEINHFLQVMENVFYEGLSDRMFDLKGSMRNRRVPLTGEQNEVLLDENFLDYISQTPLYVRNHSENLLSWTIRNDTLFCSKQNVMDYSLIVGLYDDKKEVLVGIIDYIRTYTWDKKLESWIKDRGKHKPTVMSPRAYRKRFCHSIPSYFPAVPSCWHFWTQQRDEAVQPVWDPAGMQEEEEDEEDKLGGEDAGGDEKGLH